jgi:colicin import membrane protein
MTFDDFARNEKMVSGVAAVVMHLLFFALLVFGVSWQKRQPDSAMVVDLWASLPAPPKAEAPRPEPKPEPEPPKPAPKPEPKPVPPKAEPKPPPKPEPKPTIKPDIALKEKLEKERKLKEEQQKVEQEKKRKEEQVRKEKAEALKVQQQKELAEKKQREEKQLVEKKQREEKQLAEKKQREQKEAADKAAKEQADAQRKLAAAQQAASAKMVDEYRRRISEKIKRYIVEPPNLNAKAEVEFDIVVLPGGEVLSAKLKRSSNSLPAYDSAVERAIMRAQPLPLPPDPALMSQFRELNLVFKPKE